MSREDSDKGRFEVKTNRTRKLGAALGTIAMLLVMALVAGFVSAPDAASAAQYVDSFESRLAPAGEAVKLVSGGDAASGLEISAHARTATAIRPVVSTRSTATRTVRTTGSGQPAATQTAAAPAPRATSSQADAQAILNRYIARYPILKGATVSFGDAKGYQAICYYKSGRIVISTTHTRSLETIIGHEIWHIIDWRDNGVIDWGENVPPR